ncbi:MAG TPA: PD-(D/E)XK nuclease family protein, partial [Verrucomicrobiae bacterium]
YPAQAATRRKAKASVTALRREAAELEAEAEAETLAPAPPPRWQRPKGKGRPQPALSPAEIGAAHHTFFQHVALDKLADLAAEADRLTAAGHLSAAERAALDLPALAAFWDSDLGRQIAAQPAAVRRELQFTARFRPAEITACIGGSSEPGLADEWVVVQGVADLLVLQPGEIWLVDFKTDHLRKKGDLEDKVKTYTPQLQLYAAALERIYTRPVTLQALHFLHGHRTVKLGDRQPTATRP